MTTCRYVGATVYGIPRGRPAVVDVAVDQGVITGFGRDARMDRTTQVVDLDGWSLSTGFIDLQVNGGWGADLTIDPTLVWNVGELLTSVGVTSWLPTLVSAAPEVMATALQVLDDGPPPGWRGALPLGWHFEGPWLNPGRRGAHAESSMVSPPTGLELVRQARLVTLAPEVPNATRCIDDLVAAGVIVSVGHSDASSAQTIQALDHGVSMGTHLFNAMSGLHHREPGVAAGLLLDERPFIGLITDGYHCSAEMVRLAWRLAQDRVVLVSDAMAAAGAGDGRWSLSTSDVFVTDGAARLEDGTLAGSVISMRDAVTGLIEMTGCETADALRSASAIPAQALGLTDRGAISVGARADFVVLGERLTVEATIVGGELVHESAAFRQRREQQWKS